MCRYSDFRVDNNIGKIGEIDFKNNWKSVISQRFPYNFWNADWRYIDVSDIRTFQRDDIDVLIMKSSLCDCCAWTEDEKYDIIDGRFGDKSTIKVEIKTDTWTYRSRNIVFEMMSHYKCGCGLKTKADYFYYVCVDNKNVNHILARYLIRISELRKFYLEHIFLLKNDGSNKTSIEFPMALKRVDVPLKNGEMDDPILDTFMNIDALLKNNSIAQEIII